MSYCIITFSDIYTTGGGRKKKVKFKIILIEEYEELRKLKNENENTLYIRKWILNCAAFNLVVFATLNEDTLQFREIISFKRLCHFTPDKLTTFSVACSISRLI